MIIQTIAILCLGFLTFFKVFKGFFKFMFVLIGVAYLRCRQYLRNSTAALTIRYLDKVADLAKLTRKKTT